MGEKLNLSQVLAGLLEQAGIPASINETDAGCVILLGARLQQDEWRALLALARAIENLSGEVVWVVPAPARALPVHQGKGRK